MKKKALIVGLTLAAALLSACSAQTHTAWETVDDEIVESCACWQQEARTLHFDVPQDAVLQSETEDGTRRLYTAEDGAYEITAEVLLDVSEKSVVRTLTGFLDDRITPVETTRDGKKECRFAWYAGSDEGGRLLRADAIFDAPYCYVLVFASDEGSGAKYDSTADSVFASMTIGSDSAL